MDGCNEFFFIVKYFFCFAFKKLDTMLSLAAYNQRK
jgi:hypothetical protein